VSIIQIWHTPLWVFLHLLKNKSPCCMYNFGDAMWFASDEESNGKGDM
jgi:hypothetical protein